VQSKPDPPTNLTIDKPVDKPDGLTPIGGASTSITGFIGSSRSGPLQKATSVTSFPQYVGEFGELDASSEMGFAAKAFFDNGGTSLYAVRAVEKDCTLSLQSVQEAMAALDSVPALNLVYLPGVTDASILAAAAEYCEKRRAFLIIDADAKATTVEQFTAMMKTAGLPRSESAAVYAPWLRIPDPLGGSGLRTIAPSGAVAGIYARTDSNSGVWKAPAGTGANLLGATALTAEIDDGQNEVLEELGLNLLRSFPSYGIVIWGARTLLPPGSGDSTYKYVPVRRLSLYIESSLSSGTQWAVFEPNGPSLWASVRLSVSGFLQGLYQQGAFQGVTPDQAYFVKCDATTMTQSDIDQGILNIVVGFAPLKPAEFVLLRIQQLVKKP
jgi:uncharacterized protein